VNAGAVVEVSRGTTGRAADAALQLYKHHGERVYSFCMSRLRNAEEAQDAAQTTFVYVLTALKRGVVPRNELAWLLTIADNVCRSSRRSLGRRLAHVSNADVDELEAAATSMSAETSEQIEGLRAALEQLPETQRRAILLREWQGLSYADIADELGLSVAAVETLLFRARRGLTARLERPSRLRVLDLGSALAFVRSLLGGGAGKLAVGSAGLALVAAGPALERDVLATNPQQPMARASVVVPRTAQSMPKSAGRKTVPRPVRARTASVGPMRLAGPTAVAPHPRAVPVSSTTPTAPPVAGHEPAKASPEPAAVSVPTVTVPTVTTPVLDPPAPVTSAVSSVTETTSAVVSSTTQALPVLPGHLGP
jgi:RNA polymerase sigma factor (sigma-70 family)